MAMCSRRMSWASEITDFSGSAKMLPLYIMFEEHIAAARRAEIGSFMYMIPIAQAPHRTFKLDGSYLSVVLEKLEISFPRVGLVVSSFQHCLIRIEARTLPREIPQCRSDRWFSRRSRCLRSSYGVSWASSIIRRLTEAVSRCSSSS